jgi:hypothetical protein
LFEPVRKLGGFKQKMYSHIQDWAKLNENFDLTITTLDKAAMDKVVTFEGTIILNKGFGYGYSQALTNNISSKASRYNWLSTITSSCVPEADIRLFSIT